jgi:hypothetical protein
MKYKLKLSFAMRLLQHGVNGERAVENLLQWNIENGENPNRFLWART